MAEKKAFYITTTLPYVNADPHIGFATELIQADVLARYHESIGDDVFLNTGTDEHGLKIYQKSVEEGKDVESYVAEYAEKFKDLKRVLGLSDDIHFIRTTEDRHTEAAQEIWKRCVAKGDIDKRKYKGLYCVADEAFVKETELVNGRCPNHPNTDLVEIEEENYFFRLSNYRDRLTDYLKKTGVVIPDWRREEALGFANTVEDISISRDASRLHWGVPVPGDDTQVMYVWFDALTSYISTLGWPKDYEGLFKKFWEKGKTVQLAGKDQVRFQSIIWQAMLMSADIKNTDQVFYHGFINSGGQKMSKSIGNVISPYDLVKKYGMDATRYLLLRHIHPTDDTDVTWERLDEWYEAGLANGLGNLVSRVLTMAEKYRVSTLDSLHSFDHPNHVNIDSFNFQEYVNNIWELIQKTDKKIQDNEPYKKYKTNPEIAVKIVADLCTNLYEISYLLDPVMPDTAKKIKESLATLKKPENLFPRLV